MAGRPKKWIDYAGWNTNIFDSDGKIDKLLDAQGWAGFGIYFYLCQKAYASDGYYYKWNYDDTATTARKMGGGMGSETVKNTVGLCLRIGLFDNILFDREGILTSKGIQRKYLIAIAKRDAKQVIAEYWLLNEDESAGLIKVHLNSDSQTGNSHSQTGNSHSSPKKRKERKGKESKPQYAREGEGENEARDVIADYEGMIGRSINTVEAKQLQQWLLDLNPSLIRACIRVAAENNARSLSYVKAVIQNSMTEGCTTAEQFENRMRSWKQRKQSQKTHGVQKTPFGNFDQPEYSDEFLNTFVEKLGAEE